MVFHSICNYKIEIQISDLLSKRIPVHPPLRRGHLTAPPVVAAPQGRGKNTDADIPSHRFENTSKWDCFAAEAGT